MASVSYGEYLELVDRVMESGESVQVTLTRILHDRLSGITLPPKISDLTRKARKFVSSGGSLNTVFLSPHLTKDNVLSFLEENFGVTTEQLVNLSCHLTSADHSNRMAFELEKFRRTWSYSVVALRPYKLDKLVYKRFGTTFFGSVGRCK